MEEDHDQRSPRHHINRQRAPWLMSTHSFLVSLCLVLGRSLPKCPTLYFASYCKVSSSLTILLPLNCNVFYLSYFHQNNHRAVPRRSKMLKCTVRCFTSTRGR